MPSYFINPDIDALATASPEHREALIRKIAACVGDECALRSIIGISPEEFRNFYPDMTPRNPSTDDTISSFISIFSSEKKAATPQVENLVPEQKTQDTTTASEPQDTTTASEPIVPTAPAIDYALLMDDPEEEQADETSQQTGDATADLITSFLQAVPPKTPTHRTTQNQTNQPKAPIDPNDLKDPKDPNQQEEAKETPELSEALFRLMVKNKNYAKALEIIQELSLNNPKKSVYFATQTRFLKKLIQIEGNKRR